MTVSLRCPFCAESMVEVGHELNCVSGGMGLSERMRESLEEYVRSAPSRPEGPSVRWGGTWHCPLDGALMEDDDRLPRCPSCGRYLSGRVLYDLIELHPHG